MSLRRLALCASLCAALAWARTASASGAEAGVGADFMVDDNAGGFLATLALDTPVARKLTVGARFGLFLESDPTRLGIPLDVRLRLRLRKAYVDGLVGPWIVFRDDQKIRFHAGVGAGIYLRRNVTLGAELGYLDPSAMLGARIAFGF
jgi:hypothetical protein